MKNACETFGEHHSQDIESEFIDTHGAFRILCLTIADAGNDKFVLVQELYELIIYNMTQSTFPNDGIAKNIQK